MSSLAVVASKPLDASEAAAELRDFIKASAAAAAAVAEMGPPNNSGRSGGEGLDEGTRLQLQLVHAALLEEVARRKQ